jgi:carbamoyl-phosphate synthase small subunit
MNEEYYINRKTARLILEDGSEYIGYSFGAEKSVAGEVVFNTGMIGYPESLTDPSYKGQILVFTFPLIGNYGVAGDNDDILMSCFESERIQVEGIIVSNYSHNYSHWQARKSLSEWLIENNVPAIGGIDTREITKKLREKGTMLGKILFSDNKLPFEDPNKRNLVKEVSIEEPIVYRRGSKKVILVDCGVKVSIIKAFLNRGITVIRCPWDYDFTGEEADGVVISNGPGDPKMCVETIENVRKILGRSIPILGICLGSQILGLASGADTYKLKYGHRGQNQPCLEAGTKRCYITSQNHGYAVSSETLAEDWREWFYNNNDGSNEGIKHISKPYFGTQFHPEASPGPDDTEFIFDMFVRAL